MKRKNFFKALIGAVAAIPLMAQAKPEPDLNRFNKVHPNQVNFDWYKINGVWVHQTWSLQDDGTYLHCINGVPVYKR